MVVVAKIGEVVFVPDAACEVRTIPIYPGYAAGEDGTVWSCRGPGGKWKRLSSRKNDDGYMVVGLRWNGRRVSELVHRLVLFAFAGPCPPGHECLHRDGNQSNNHRTNLRWGTPQANALDRRRHGTITTGVKNGNARLSEEDVQQIRLVVRLGIMSQADASRSWRVAPQTVQRIVSGQGWRHLSDERQPARSQG